MPVFVFCWLPIADYHGNVVVIIDPGDKPQYQCELCPTTCGRKTDLWLHVQKLHTSEKPMSCKLCEKSFPDRYTLKMHKKSHDGEKCFRCELCPYSSISQVSSFSFYPLKLEVCSRDAPDIWLAG